MREFEVKEHMLKKKCLVCNKKFILGEKIILCPIQASKEGWQNVRAIPIHTKCYWIGVEDE